MVFSSAIFLFAFLPLVLLLDRAFGLIRFRTGQNLALLTFSLLFYAYGEGYYVLLMLASITVNYVVGMLISASEKTVRRLWLVFGVLANILALGYYKYFGFLVENANALLELTGHRIDAEPVHLPIGISFFTFQAISYIVDLYKREVRVQKNPFDLALYITMFPQLIAGPIVRYESIQDEIDNRRATLADIASGMRLFAVGLFQKAVIADTLAKIVDQSLADVAIGDFTTPMAWLWIVCYALQIFFDFAGYSIMALGLGRVFGFSFPLNFDQPYISTSIREFWRRWHISLSSWFRDYVFIPLGGSRGGALSTYRNLLIVFFVTGIWHGASWNFVIWGMFHGLFIVLERSRMVGGVLNAMPFVLKRLYLILVVLVGWVFFRIEALPDALGMLQKMFTWQPVVADTPVLANPLYYLDAWTLTILCLGLVWALVSPERGRWLAGRFGAEGSVTRTLCLNVGALALLLVAVAIVVSGSYTAFIYFRF